MSLSLEALTSVICATPTEDASFFSLAYVAALQQCTACAYAPTLHALSGATKPTGVGGDAVADCIARVRLETERRVAGQQRTALLQEHVTLQTAENGHRLHPTLSADIDAPPALTAAPSQSTAASGRRRASSGPGGKHSRRASRRASSAAGSHSSGHLSGGGGAGGAAGARRGSREAAMDAAAAGGGGASPASSSTPLTIEAAVRLLREGLVRAFGWSPPTAAEETNPASKSESGCTTAAAALTGLADAVLSRRTYAPSTPLQSHEGVGSSAAFSPSGNAPRPMPPLYMELEDEEGRLDVVLEWIEDVLLFALHHGFSTPQTQAVLLDSVLLLRVVEDTSGGHAVSEAVWEERVCEALQEVLSTQACPTVARVMEKVRQRQPVVREVPDPVQLAELEQKRLKATTAKALAALDAALAGIPLVTQTVMEEVEIEVERDATLPALFSMVEAAAVVEFLTRSTVMHRQLWRLMTCEGGPKDGAVARGPARPVVHVPLCAYVEDVPPVFLPPLSDFYPSRLQGEVDAQQSLYRECAAEKERLYAAKFTGPLGAIAAEESGQRAALTNAARIAAAADCDAALTAEECVHVEKAFQLRLRDVVVQNARVARGSTSPLSPGGVPEGGAERSAAAASSGTVASVSRASVADAVARKSKASVSVHAAVASSKGSVSASNVLGHSLVSADVAAALPALVDAAFSLSEVERRVERVAAAAESMPSAGAAGAAGRGGPRKR